MKHNIFSLAGLVLIILGFYLTLFGKEWKPLGYILMAELLFVIIVLVLPEIYKKKEKNAFIF